MITTPSVLAIAGGSGAGKSTLSSAVRQRLGAQSSVVLPLEAYFRDRSDLPVRQRALLNFDEPDAVDVELLVSDLNRLCTAHAIDRPWYDMTKHARGEGTVHVELASVVIVDGHLSLAIERCRALYDFAVFVSTPSEVRLRRRLARDVVERARTPESIREQWFRSVLPMHEEHISPSMHHADLVVDGRDDVSLLADRVVQAMGRRS